MKITVTHEVASVNQVDINAALVEISKLGTILQTTATPDNANNVTNIQVQMDLVVQIQPKSTAALHNNISVPTLIRRKRGPKSHPKSPVKFRQLFPHITTAVGKNAVDPKSIYEAVKGKFSNIDPEIPRILNSWALVDMQNENCDHGSGCLRTGPLIKLSDERYCLRKHFSRFAHIGAFYPDAVAE